MQLTRQLGLASVTALVVGEVIAVGIFLTPAGMAHTLGSPFWLLVVWLIMGAMALSGALCYGELAARLPEAGGGYVYLRRAYGPAVAFLYGWKCLLVMDPGITAALAVGLASYVAYVVPLTAVGMKVVSVSAIVVLAATNIIGLRFGARLMQWLTALKVGALLLMALLAVVLSRGSWSHFLPFVAQRAGSAPLPGALAPALVGAFFAFGGWWEISKLGGEARDPARTLPRALAIGVSIITAVYILTSAVFLYLVPLERVTSGETFAAQAGEALFGPAGGRVFAAIVIVAVLGSMLALLMALPRAYYAMSRDGLFFKGVAAIHPRFGTPARAIALQATLASILVLLGTFGQIVSYFIFITVLFVGLTVAAVFVLRRRDVAAPDYRTPGYPVTPVFFLVLVAGLLFLLAGHNPVQAALGVGIVALGVPVYFLVFRRRTSEGTAP
ncbi:MAG TPA: amino acid permease [Gemmatimonadales bacterium]|jgi:APA family basic amino acid/polyamine antiporter|nr:amino acid permease [Gemmatimonadales bacterium]